MANVLRTGSVVTIDQTANSGSQSITVPSDANCIVVSVSGWWSGATSTFLSNASLTLGGVSIPYRVSSFAGDDFCGEFVLASASLPTGSQTFAWDFEGTNTFSDGGRLSVAFYKNVDTTSPIRDTDSVVLPTSEVSSATLTSGTLASEAGDAIVCALYVYDTTNPTGVTWTNATELVGSVYNSSWGGMAEGFPSGNTTVTVDPTGNSGDDLWLPLATVVLAHDTAPQVEPTGTPVHIDTTSASSSQSVTVPSDATLMVVAGGGYFGNVSIANPVFTLASTNCVRQVGGSPGGDFDAGVVETYANPPTGSQTLAWTFPTILDGSIKIEVVFYKNVNTAAPVSDTGRIDHNTITSGTETITGLTAPTGSMTFGASWSDSLPVVSGNGQTSIAQSANTSVRGAWGQKRESTSFEATNQVYSMLLAIVIDPLTATPQYAYPVADTVIDNWETLAGGTSNLYQQIDEVSASDTDGVRSQLSPSNDVYTCELGALTDPAVNTGHTFDFRYGKDAANGDVISLLLQLRYGYTNESSQGTLIATLLNSSNIPDGWNAGSYTLTGTEADNIPSADYGNGLYVRAVANKESSGYVRPTFVGGTSGTGTTSSYNVSLTSLTGGSGSSPQTGDVIVVYHSCGGTADVDMTCSGNNSGTFTEVGDWFSDDTRDVNLGVFIQVVGATPDTQITVNGAPTNYAAATVLHVWRGVDTTTPQDVTATVDATTTNSGRPITPAITPTTDKAVIISGGAGSGANTMTAALTTPTGTSIGQGVSVKADGSSADVTVGMFAYTGWDSGEGAYDPPNYAGGGSTSTSDARRGVTLALRPAAAPRRAQISWERFQVPAASGTPKEVTDTASGTDSAAAPTVALAPTESAAGTDTGALVFVTSVSDSAAGTDSAVVAQPKEMSDSAAGTDTAAAPTAALTVTDPATGADSATRNAALTVTDPATGTDSATRNAALAVTDPAAGADTGALAAALAGTDPGTGSDSAAAPAVATDGTDTAAGTDSATVDQGAVQKTVTDTATGDDSAAAPTAALAGSDAGTGTDSASVDTGAVQQSVTDTASGTDTAAAPTAALALTEAANGTDVGALAFSASVTDSAAGTDTAAAPIAALGLSEPATGSDSAALAAALSGSDNSVGDDTGAAAAALTCIESASATEVVVVYVSEAKPVYEQRMGITMLEQSKADYLTVFMRDAVDHMTGVTGATLTLKLSKAGGTFSIVSRTVTEIGAGAYRIALQAGDSDTPGDLLVLASATGCDDSLVIARVIEDIDANLSMTKAMRALLAPLSGQADDLGSATETFYDTTGLKVRFTSSVDANGRRTVTLNDLT